MDFAAAVTSFVALAGAAAQGLKFIYDLTTDMKDCPQDIRAMRIDLGLVEALITQVIQQCHGCQDVQLGHSAALRHAIARAQESVRNLNEQLLAYQPNRKRSRLVFALKSSRLQKLRTNLERTKTIMLELKNQLSSDLLYHIRDTNEEILRTGKETSRLRETYDENFLEITRNLQIQTDTINTTMGRAENSIQVATHTFSESLLELEIMDKKLDHIIVSLTETKISASEPSTPDVSREASEMSSMASSPDTNASSISSSRNSPRFAPQHNQQLDIDSRHPLLRFKNNDFQFLVACIFTQSVQNQNLACKRAAECLAAYPTAQALSQAKPKDLKPYFENIGLQNSKPTWLINLALTYVKDAPKSSVLRSKRNTPRSEISHLPRIGPKAVESWWVYCQERTDVETGDGALLEYMEYLKMRAM